MLVVKRRRQSVGIALGRHARLRVTAVNVPAGESRRQAEVLRAAAAECARAVGPGQPGHADPVTDGEPVGALAKGVDPADDLMPGRSAGPVRREVALGQVQVRPADPAAADPDPHFAGAWLWFVSLDPG